MLVVVAAPTVCHCCLPLDSLLPQQVVHGLRAHCFKSTARMLGECPSLFDEVNAGVEILAAGISQSASPGELGALSANASNRSQ